MSRRFRHLRSSVAKCNVVLDCGDTCQKPKGHAAPTHGCSGHHGVPLSKKAPQLCEEHAETLLGAIRELGLQGFVSPNRKEQERRYEAGRETITADSFDPVLGAVGDIVHNFRGMATQYMTEQELDYVGPAIRCLVCFAQGLHDEHCTTNCGMKADEWLERAAEEQVGRAKGLALLPASIGREGHAPS